MTQWAEGHSCLDLLSLLFIARCLFFSSLYNSCTLFVYLTFDIFYWCWFAMRLQFFCDFDWSVFAIDLPMTDPPASKAYSSETIAAVEFLLVSVLRLDYLAASRSDAPSEKRVIFDQTLLSETNITFQCLSLIMRFEERLELVIIHLGATAGLEAIKWRLDPSMTREHQLLKGLYSTLRTISMSAII